MLEVVYRVPIVIDNGQEKSHKKLTFSINIATNQIYIAIIALLIVMGFLLLISYNYTMMCAPLIGNTPYAKFRTTLGVPGLHFFNFTSLSCD